MLIIEKDFLLYTHDEKKMTTQRIIKENFLKELTQVMVH
tara:strand:- start:772 stop:888 length:117 start_codon:yes stop_codon:yes gene_type:complete